MTSIIYQTDLAWIHHAGFGDFARSAGAEILRLLRREKVTHGTLVDLGCGSGIWAAIAQRAGFQVIGVDQSPAMLALAKRHSPKSKFVRAALEKFSLPPCNVITAMGEPFNYCAAKHPIDLRRLFGQIARALHPGGMFIFDLILHEGEPMNYRSWRAEPQWAALWEVTENRRSRKLARHTIIFRNMRGRIRRAQERHLVHLFQQSEVTQALRAAGFKFVTSRRYGRLQLPTRRLAFIASKSSRNR